MHVLDFQMLDPGDVGRPDASLSTWSEQLCVSVVSVLLCPSGPICMGAENAGNRG
ncbi:hypothetical protein [Micromonospora sp. NPDC023956]|uniref:hypothetical protein n=1 Tax=Micromonospora sp. NPDC023956 TaxID=3155722 RepID=UPI00340FD6C2